LAFISFGLCIVSFTLPGLAPGLAVAADGAAATFAAGACINQQCRFRLCRRLGSLALERDEFGMNRHRALAYCLSMIVSESRYTLFPIIL
jgi:hypothetical protein